MPHIISIVGRSGSGKTTLIERLLRHWGEGGLKIAIIKHMKHDFTVDTPGKDTFRYREAGAAASIITNDRDYAVMASNVDALSPVDLAQRFFPAFDLVIIEGYKEGDITKIEVIGDSPEGPLDTSGVRNITALVTDTAVRDKRPVFRRDDIGGVARFIEELWRA
ncbi:MAG: molybdopterin-guanine dinucleotide biosynthesis protein B [Spirochaetes bacterium]|nr:MAG: molybdopterin-guanine dinucleotide biosynthesis protein B [Spirochaetota bacterium]